MTSPRKIKKLGWIPDLPDKRDHVFALQLEPPHNSLPSSVDLRPQCPPVYDQGELGSCTANAIAAAVEFDMMKERLTEFLPSRLFIYYNERFIEGTVNEDSGAMLRDGIKSVASQGDCPEPSWPYDVLKFMIQPDQSCYDTAVKHIALNYSRIYRSGTAEESERLLKSILAEGIPFLFGFTVYESFQSDEVDKTGVVPMPQSNEVAIGGHAVLAVGYDDSKRSFLVRNSWGTDWAMNGYFTMLYEYLIDENLSDDLWVIRLVS